MPQRDFLDLWSDFPLAIGRQVGKQVVLDVGVQSAVEDPEVRAVVEGYLFLEEPFDPGVEAFAAEKVSRTADLPPVVLVAGLVRTRIGKDLHVSGVVFDGDEEKNRGIASDASDVVGDHRGQEVPPGRPRFGDQPAHGVLPGDPRRIPQGLQRPERPAFDQPRTVRNEERRNLGQEGSYCAENGQLHRVVAEPVLGGLTANDAVPQIVVFAEDVGVRVMALMVHHLPLGLIDVEVPRIEVRVVAGVVGEMVVGAVQDVVAEFGKLQQPVERFKCGGAADRAQAAGAQQLTAAGVDRLSVGGDIANMGEVVLAHRGPGTGIEALKFLDERGVAGFPVDRDKPGRSRHDIQAKRVKPQEECPYRTRI